MRELTLRPIRRQCFVPGCHNIQSFIATRSREMPVGVIVCAECAKDIYRGLYPEEEKVPEATEPEVPDTAKKTSSRRRKTEGEKTE